MKQRTIELLKYCSMNFTLRERCPRTEEYERLCSVYSEKAVWRKLEDLDAKGYIDYGTSVYSAWLTEKGEIKLKEIEE